MSLFRPVQGAGALVIQGPLWPSFDSTAPVESDSQPPDLGRDAMDLEEAFRRTNLKAAEILQLAVAEAEAAQAAAALEGFEAGRQEGLAAAAGELQIERQQVELALQRAEREAHLMRQTAAVEMKGLQVEAELEARRVIALAKEEAAQIILQARQEQHERLAQANTALVELSVAAACRLVQGQLAIAPNSIVAMVAAGLKRLKETNCTVSVSPEDLPLLEAQRSTLERELVTGMLRVQADPAMVQGSYLVNSPHGQVDGRLDQQVMHVRSALTAALGGIGKHERPAMEQAI